MTRIEQTQLPGVGVRFEFATRDGQRVGVVHHRDGRREVFVCPAEDPDAAAVVVSLTDDEAHTLVDVLGISRVVETLSQLQQVVAGLAIDWLPVAEASPFAGRSIGDTHMRTRTGVSVVAVLRGTKPIPAPGPEFAIAAGDTLVVVGTPNGIAEATRILRAG